MCRDSSCEACGCIKHRSSVELVPKPKGVAHRDTGARQKHFSVTQTNRFLALSDPESDTDSNFVIKIPFIKRPTDRKINPTLRVRPKQRDKFVLWDDFSSPKSDASDTGISIDWVCDKSSCKRRPSRAQKRSGKSKVKSDKVSNKTDSEQKKPVKKSLPPIDWDKIRRDIANVKQTQTEEQSQSIDQPTSVINHARPKLYH